jgi:hypothetical protein
MGTTVVVVMENNPTKDFRIEIEAFREGIMLFILSFNKPGFFNR